MIYHLVRLALAGAALAEAADIPLPPAIRNVFRIGVPSGLAVGVDAKGNTYVAGRSFGAAQVGTGLPVPGKNTIGSSGSPPSFFVAKVSPSGQQLVYLTEICDSDPIDDGFGAMVVNPDGSVLVAGYTRAADFPTTPGSYQPRASNGGAFLLKLDPSGRELVFSTLLDDSTSTAPFALAVDPQGNAVLAGMTSGRTFPTTPGAYQRSVPPDPGAPASVGFITRISADGGQLLASTLFSGGPVLGLAVDSTGAPHLVTPDLVAELDSSLSRAVFSRSFSPDSRPYPPRVGVDELGNTFVGLSGYYLPGLILKFDSTGALIRRVEIGSGFLDAMLVLGDGTLWAAGSTTSVAFPVRDSLQPCNMNLPHDEVPVQWWVISGSLIRLDPAGTVVLSSYFGGPAPRGYGNDSTTLTGLAQSPDGAIQVVGTTSSSDFPAGPILIGDWGGFFGFKLDTSLLEHRQPAPACLAIGTGVEAPVLPGAVMTLFGSGLGPVAGESFQLDASGRVPTELAGVRVTVGGIVAPVLYAQERQINFIVPQRVTGPTTNICVRTAAAESCLFAYVGDVFPRIFPVGNGYAVLNQDGTLNSPSNPAIGGSVISLFGTGFGPFDQTPPDGGIAGMPLPQLVNRVQAQLYTSSFGPLSAEVLYAGAAPGLVNGVVQINIRLPQLPRQPLNETVRVELPESGGTVPRYRQPLGVTFTAKP